MSQEKLAAEIMYLSALVNANTDLCVFVRYFGHIDLLCVVIVESKKNYNSKIFEDEAYTDNKNGLEGLEKIKGELVQILTNHNVFYETLFAAHGNAALEVAPEAVMEGPSIEDRVIDLETEVSNLKELVSELLEERGAANVSEELPPSPADHQGTSVIDTHCNEDFAAD